MRRVREAIEDFYVGGYQLAEKCGEYIPRLQGENPKRYADRIRSGAYVNYFAQIVDYFASALFTQELAIRPAADADNPKTPGTEPEKADVYTQFSQNADGQGCSLNEILHALIITGLKQKSGWLHLEMPPAADVPNRAAEEALGLGLPYVFEVPHDQILDWDRDDDGELTYIVVHQCKPLKGPPGARRNLMRETWEVWQRVEDAVSWARYAIEYPPDRKPRDTDPVSLEEEGGVSFPRIPLLDMELPDGLWAGNKLCPMAKEHFARRTTLNSAENRSMVAIPVAKLAGEYAAPGTSISEAQENPNRGTDPVAAFLAKGYEVIGAQDDLVFVEPEGSAYAHVAKRIDDLKDEMFRISHQMAASVSMDTAASKRSGESKKQDRVAEALVLAALGRIVRNFGVRLFETISRARGEKIEWTAHGLDTYETTERSDLIVEAAQVDAISIPSETFKRTYKFQLAKLLLENADPATLETIRAEIDEGVTAEVEMLDHENEAKHDELDAQQEASKNQPASKANGKPVGAPA